MIDCHGECDVHSQPNYGRKSSADDVTAREVLTELYAN